ncbi:hypothetical protein [Paenibacillus sp. YN15]|uniref:hypothetical protein n=1 Tax=Paenibacillus sp. YN15 TaxID=1742774 RepID=UPI000DCB60A5|nr:hypothetical protein [Paenibacillus sp. YN15]RAV05583.1 hypothetical protein DQG13_02895 [Paenibacillus sp. YN15]
MKPLKNVTLEMSLKPFKSMEPAYVEQICRKLFRQWDGLLRHTSRVSVLLWTSDGSEILDYRGRLEDEVEWAKYIGGANPRTDWNRETDPRGVGLHTRPYLYMEEPPVLTYRLLGNIVKTIKRVGAEYTGQPIRVGATFDPGPEFAKSSFKYERHEEICMGNTMGNKSFVCCYSVLHADSEVYAGFPEGIPEGTPFGTFFGRQCRAFARDLEFDYVWLSNGFGFGTETWGTTGALFDGAAFNGSRMGETTERILEFWRLFRLECPELPVETRGTNLSAGIDLATDGVPLKDIYEGGFQLLSPPNSPWAALDGDFGLELTGYMSRMAELPADARGDFLYRFYVHDPWWMNSPWLDRYEGQPHDIYLPLSISRINGEGEAAHPSHLSLLTVDNSLGDMPDQCPNEIIPHLLKAYERLPDAPAPLVWVYPFREYHGIGQEGGMNIRRPFFEDWFIRGAINQGLPLSSVVSTDHFAATLERKPGLYAGSIPVSPVPLAGSRWEEALCGWIESGGQAILYGSVREASPRLLFLLNLSLAEPLEGELDFRLHLKADEPVCGSWPEQICHRAVLCDGGIDTILLDAHDPFTWLAAEAGSPEQGGSRTAALVRRLPAWGSGGVAWVRGTVASSFRKGSHLLVPDDPARYFPAEALMRHVLAELGTAISFRGLAPNARRPVVMAHRSNGALFFSCYVPDTTAELSLRYPWGAPLLMGWETRLEQGSSLYRLPRAWHGECRVFIKQEKSAVLACKEICSTSYEMKRRFQVSGLIDAELLILPETGYGHRTELLLNSSHPFQVGDALDWELTETPWGTAIAVHRATGVLTVSTPFS